MMYTNLIKIQQKNGTKKSSKEHGFMSHRYWFPI